jgi:hypothetical protein
MTTYPILDEASGHAFAFEVENAYVSSSAVARLLTGVDGVTAVQRQKAFRGPGDIHVDFKFLGRDYLVWEPFGDSSRYWIGPKDAERPAPDIRTIEDRFRSYRPPLYRKVIGDVLSFRFLRRHSNKERH